MRQLQLNQVNYIISKLSGISIFHHLSDDEKWELLKICQLYEYDPGEAIINQGELGTCFYAILSGTVNVTVTDSSSGREVFLSVIGEGEFFGENGIFSNAKRTANVTAAQTSEILCIQRIDFFTFITKFKSAGLTILMLFVDGLLKKLNGSNQELAFERRNVLDQSAVDQFLKTLNGN